MNTLAYRNDLRNIKRKLPIVNFISFLAISFIEFAIPYIAVSNLGATPFFVAGLGIARYLPQVAFAQRAANIINKGGYKKGLIFSEILRVLAFIISILALFVEGYWTYILFTLATILISVASLYTGISISVLVPYISSGKSRTNLYSHLAVSESSADALGPFLGGLLIGSLGSKSIFVVAIIAAACCLVIFIKFPLLNIKTDRVEAKDNYSDSLLSGFKINFRNTPLRLISIWGFVYNFGQSVFMSFFLIVLIQKSDISAEKYGLLMSAGIVFAVIGSYLPNIFSRLSNLSKMTFSIISALALLSYTVMGFSVVFYTTVLIVLLGMILDELFSAASGVYISNYRSNVISHEERAISSAANRSLGMFAVVLGYAAGATLSIFFNYDLILIFVAVAMGLISFSMFHKKIINENITNIED